MQREVVRHGAEGLRGERALNYPQVEGIESLSDWRCHLCALTSHYMTPELLKTLGAYGPGVLLGAVLIWTLPSIFKEWLAHCREMTKIKGEEQRKRLKFNEQIEATKRKRLERSEAKKR